MERQTALILEYVFGGITAIFILIWFFGTVLPILIAGSFEPEVLLIIFVDVFFFLGIGFAIVAGIFTELKKNAPTQTVSQQQQQQQQQVITVNIPQPQTVQEASDSVFCTQCGFKNMGDAKFCKKCGAKI